MCVYDILLFMITPIDNHKKLLKVTFDISLFLGPKTSKSSQTAPLVGGVICLIIGKFFKVLCIYYIYQGVHEQVNSQGIMKKIENHLKHEVLRSKTIQHDFVISTEYFI